MTAAERILAPLIEAIDKEARATRRDETYAQAVERVLRSWTK